MTTNGILLDFSILQKKGYNMNLLILIIFRPDTMCTVNTIHLHDHDFIRIKFLVNFNNFSVKNLIIIIVFNFKALMSLPTDILTELFPFLIRVIYLSMLSFL